ncbi:maleylpyruvate isomerase family mycothiol-dependent enzyme [Streptomyces sp. NPDC059506]|uniref:maleylpyruvate isomerase family mycothiol-dependent enzyme n=1 Tax=Streptomyces TaxID=1883 RepID=UPI000CAA3CF8|nr:hypothetical protein C0036_07810 [Streptomyces sp. DJ]
MDAKHYLDLIRADSDRLLAAAASDLDSPVPSCPDWTAADLVRHVGGVYEHKILCMRLGRMPEDGERTTPPAAAADLPAWFTRVRDALLDELASRDPRQPSPTWFPPDQTVGFWYRRMAHETAVHRVDAEQAAGPGRETPVDPELAADGVDEFLGFLTHDFGGWAVRPDDAGRTVSLRCAGRRWDLVLTAERVVPAAEATDPAPSADTAPDLLIEGDPSDLLLRLWGRHPLGDASVACTGDPAALDALRFRTREATR